MHVFVSQGHPGPLVSDVLALHAAITNPLKVKATECGLQRLKVFEQDWSMYGGLFVKIHVFSESQAGFCCYKSKNHRHSFSLFCLEPQPAQTVPALRCAVSMTAHFFRFLLEHKVVHLC